MTAAEFRAKRRQKFLTEDYYQLNQKLLKLLIDTSIENLRESEAAQTPDPSSTRGIFKDKLDLLKLHYTAGCPIETLKPLYADVVQALIDWHVAYREYIRALAAESGDDLREDGTPLHFENMLDYQLALDVVSLGVLLGEGNALRQIALWMQSERGTDLLFESLLAPAVPDPRDNNDFYHITPYDPLIDVFYTAETPAEASAKMKEYLGIWYKSFEGAPWHDGHLHAVAGEYMPYYGYWAFETAAVCLINNIDDSSFRDHILYPKDLAAWARENNSLSHLKPGSANPDTTATHHPNVPANQPCPETGWWFTPAQAGSRRYFRQGAIMPNLDSDYGATFWQWSPDQSAPTL